MRDFALEFDPRLVEECVLLAIERADRVERSLFRRERDALYELADEEHREGRFQELARRWFVHLNVPRPLWQALEEQPAALDSLSRGWILAATSASDEAADLHDNRGRPGPAGEASGERRPVLVVRLRPTTLLDPARLLPFLRHELQHVADMLDPEFGYERTSSPGTGRPLRDGLQRERYRVLWDTTIDGRLFARGLLHSGVEDLRRREFEATFPMLGTPGVQESFERFFRGPRPRHQELWAFASQPAQALASTPRSGARCCPLCAFPSTRFHGNPQTLSRTVVAAIRHEFPAWTVEAGLCVQCADLYSAREVLTTSLPREPM